MNARNGIRWLSVGAVALITILGGWGCGRNRSQIHSSLLEPGDPRLDTRSMIPYTRRYEVHYVRSLDSVEADTVVGHLTEQVERDTTHGVAVLLRVRTIQYNDGGSETDSLILNQSTLAPLQLRIARSDHAYRGGINFHGNVARHFGTIPEESVDTSLTRALFLAGTETVLIPTILRSNVTLPVRIPVIDFVQTDWVFSLEEKSVGIVRPDVAYDPQGGVWRVRFGSDNYWVEKESLRVLKWDRRPIEGTFVVVFETENSP